MMNLSQPSVKLLRTVRVGSRLQRLYDHPQTPLDRFLASGHGDPARLQALQNLRQHLDPFALAEAIQRKLARIFRLASRPSAPTSAASERTVHPDISRHRGSPLAVGGGPARFTPRDPSVTPSVARRWLSR